GRRRPGHGVGVLGGFRLLVLFLPWSAAPVEIEFVPRDFVLAHPDRPNLHGMLRPLLVLALLLAGRAAHDEFTARDGYHVERNLGPRNNLGIGFVPDGQRFVVRPRRLQFTAGPP